MKQNIEDPIVKDYSLPVVQGKVTFTFSNVDIISVRHVTGEIRLEDTSCNVHAHLGNKEMEFQQNSNNSSRRREKVLKGTQRNNLMGVGSSDSE